MNTEERSLNKVLELAWRIETAVKITTKIETENNFPQYWKLRQATITNQTTQYATSVEEATHTKAAEWNAPAWATNRPKEYHS